MKNVALITGSSRGIGRGVALELAREGWDICVNYIQQKAAAEEVVSQIRAMGRNAVAIQADVADSQAVSAMVRQAETELGHISLLVNNAGVAGQSLFQDISDEMWNRYLGVNLGGARNTIRAVLPNMLHEKSGCIINISSMWGLRGASCEVAYACTKAALIALTRSLALELISVLTALLPESLTQTWFRSLARMFWMTWPFKHLWADWAPPLTSLMPSPFSLLKKHLLLPVRFSLQMAVLSYNSMRPVMNRYYTVILYYIVYKEKQCRYLHCFFILFPAKAAHASSHGPCTQIRGCFRVPESNLHLLEPDSKKTDTRILPDLYSTACRTSLHLHRKFPHLPLSADRDLHTLPNHPEYRAPWNLPESEQRTPPPAAHHLSL